MADLAIGDQAPSFNLPGTDGSSVSLESHRGHAVVLYFYPKDDTSGCTAEAIAFTRLLPEFEAGGATVIGISPDSVKKHESFVKKRELAVTLASDETTEVCQRYGVWKQKSMYGRSYMGVERTTLLIDADGKIARIWPKVKVEGHAEEVLDAVRAL